MQQSLCKACDQSFRKKRKEQKYCSPACGRLIHNRTALSTSRNHIVAAMTNRERILQQSVPEPNTGCWLWEGTTTPDGYAQVSLRNKMRIAHRVSYEEFKGPIPSGLQLDHLCRVRCCVNPDHLEPVTNLVNSQRASVVRTHCRKGHEFTAENTYLDPRTSARRCRKCQYFNSSEYLRRKKLHNTQRIVPKRLR